MLEVVVLRPGGSRTLASGAVQATCTVSLIRGDGLCAIVDTGGPAERDVIVGLLAEQGLTPADVQYAVCTHGHVDHVGNLNLFPGATILAGRDRSVADTFTTLEGPVHLADGVEVLPTPGHTSDDLSVIVKTNAGVVAIAGDVFENGDPADQSWQDVSWSPAAQHQGRALLLSRADFIVPGHGEIFATLDFRRPAT